MDTALEAGSDEGIRSAFELLSNPHLFAGWQVAERVVPEDPSLAGLTEDALFEAMVDLPPLEAPFQGRSTLSTCDQRAECVWRDLVRGNTTLERVKLWYYLRLRRALARGDALSTEMHAFFTQYPSLFTRAVRRQLDLGTYGFGADMTGLLKSLRDALAVSIRNTWIFCAFCGLCSLMFWVMVPVWNRVPWRRAELSEDA